jgi:hypothetical protein
MRRLDFERVVNAFLNASKVSKIFKLLPTLEYHKNQLGQVSEGYAPPRPYSHSAE